MKIENSQYKSFGNVIKVTTDNYQLMITTDIGPRVIYFGDENYNLFYEDIDNNINFTNDFIKEKYGEDARWDIIGGHRLWKAPEFNDTYSIDNKPYEYNIENNVITLSAKNSAIDIEKIIEIKINENNVELKHTIVNFGDEVVNVANWPLTVLRAGGELSIEMNNLDMGLLPANNLVLWSYTDLQDSRLKFENNTMFVKQDENAQSNFKIGMYSKKGLAKYKVDGYTFVKEFQVVDTENYPDYTCNFECFTNQYMMEMESLSPLVDLKKGESISHKEKWTIEK